VKEKETVLLEVRPVEAVADAMMVAVYKQIEKKLRFYEDSDLETILKKTTKENCRLGSAMVLSYLEEKYSKMFPLKLAIEAIDPYGITLVQGWGWHDYFLVWGRDGFWYAGSPANFGLLQGEERTTNLIYSRNLATVIESIQHLEGGRWPETKEIYKVMNGEFDDARTILFEDQGDKAVNFLLVSSEMSGTSSRRISVKV